MSRPTNPSLPDILIAILVIATRTLRAVHLHAATAQTLKTILAANLAGARIGRAIRLATLLIRRIHNHGLNPFAPARPIPAHPIPAATRPDRAPIAPGTPRFHTGNGDAAFIRRPIHVIVAAITRELHLAAKALNLPLPEQLQTLCLQATLASTPSEPSTPAETPTAPPARLTHPELGNDPLPERDHPGATPPPWQTLEL